MNLFLKEGWKIFKTLKYDDEFLNKYEINEFGEIRNSKTNKIRTHIIDKDGYHKLTVYDDNGKIKNIKIHRAVYFCFGSLSIKDNGGQINHIDGNKDNNHISNLEPVNSKRNINHAFELGLRKNFGENSNLNKYSESEIRFVCELMEKGYTNKEIKEYTNLSKTAISDIRNGRTWKRISSEYNIPKNKSVRITEEQVYLIKYYIKKGFSNKEISSMVNIDHKQISAIRCKKRHRK